jgi:hypothetical protein
MKRFCLLLLAVMPLLDAHARIVTLIVDTTTTRSNSLQIAANETVIVRSQYNVSAGAEVFLKMSGHSVNFGSGIAQFLPVAGPAEISIRMFATDPSFWGYMTFEIVTDTFPPDKTIIIPEGTGARIALECSTNLTHWTEVYSTTHTNSPSNKFFRIKAERTP